MIKVVLRSKTYIYKAWDKQCSYMYSPTIAYNNTHWGAELQQIILPIILQLLSFHAVQCSYIISTEVTQQLFIVAAEKGLLHNNCCSVIFNYLLREQAQLLEEQHF